MIRDILWGNVGLLTFPELASFAKLPFLLAADFG